MRQQSFRAAELRVEACLVRFGSKADQKLYGTRNKLCMKYPSMAMGTISDFARGAHRFETG